MVDHVEWPVVRKLIVDALTADGPRRLHMIDEAPLEPALKTEIEQLLSACVREMDFEAMALFADTRDRPDPAPANYEFAPGHQIGPYSIVRSLGRGGMGEVYLALDSRLLREIAIKVLRKSATGRPLDESGVVREARAAAQLNHRHIAAVHDVFHEGGRAFIVMEYVRGMTLADYSRERSIDYKAA